MQKHTCTVDCNGLDSYTLLQSLVLLLVYLEILLIVIILYVSRTGKLNLSVLLAYKGIVWIWRVLSLSVAVILTHEHQARPVVRDLAVRRELVKSKMNSSKQTHFKPQHNTQDTKIHCLVFL